MPWVIKLTVFVIGLFAAAFFAYLRGKNQLPRSNSYKRQNRLHVSLFNVKDVLKFVVQIHKFKY